MADEDPLNDKEIEQIALNLERGLGGPWEIRRLIVAWRGQRRVLRHLFDLFVTNEDGLRSQSDSIRSVNLEELKKDVGLED